MRRRVRLAGRRVLFVVNGGRLVGRVSRWARRVRRTRRVGTTRRLVRRVTPFNMNGWPLCCRDNVCEAGNGETWREQLRVSAAGPGVPAGRQGPPSGDRQPRPRGRAEGVGTTGPTRRQLRPPGSAAVGHPPGGRVAAA